MISGSKCRDLNRACRGLIMGYPAAYQARATLPVGSPWESAFADMADLHREPREEHGVHRLLHRAYHSVPGVVRIGGTEHNRVSHHDIIQMSVTQLSPNFGEFSPKRHLSLAFVCFHMYPDHSVRKFRIPPGII